MSLRICPNCHNFLGNYNHYFCSTCGSVLPKEFVNDQVEVKIKDYNPFSSIKTDKFPVTVNLDFLKGLFHPQAFLGIVLIMTLWIGTMFMDRFIPNLKFLATPQPSNNSVETSMAVVSMQLLDLPVAGTPMNFDSQTLNEYVPAEAELYLYSNNIGEFISNLSDINVYDELFSKLPESLDKPFVMYTIDHEGSKDWAIIIPQSTNLLLNEILLSSLNDFAVYSYSDDYLLIASNTQTLQNSMDAKNKLSLSISLNPKYVQAEEKLPKSGLIKIIFLADAGKESFEDVKNYKVGNALKNTIDAVLKTGYNELVII